MFNTSRFMKFTGGRNLVYSLFVLILIGLMVFVFNKVSFIFRPIIIILSTLAPPIILAFIAFYLLNPIVNLLERIKIKRIWGIILIILAFLGIVTGLAIISVPAIQSQISDMINDFPGYIETVSNGFQSFISNSIFEQYYEEARTWLDKNLGEIPDKIGQYISSGIEGLAGFANALTTVIVTLITFPFVLFFLLKDADNFKAYSLKLFPKRFRTGIVEILHNMDTQVGSYIRGQIFVALCIGALLYVGYLIIGLKYAIILAIIAAVTSVVPYLGPIIAITPAIIIALVTSPWMLLKLAIVWAIVQLLEGNFISPNVMGKTMKTHPLTIMFVLLVAGKLFGLVGVILGIPGYALLQVLVKHVFAKFKIRYNKYYNLGYEEIEVNKEES